MTARYRRSDQIDRRLRDDLEVEGTTYTVDLIAKKATGVEGYRMTLSFLQADGPDSRFVQLDPADDREAVERRADELADDPGRLRDLLRAER